MPWLKKRAKAAWMSFCWVGFGFCMIQNIVYMYHYVKSDDSEKVFNKKNFGSAEIFRKIFLCPRRDSNPQPRL